MKIKVIFAAVILFTICMAVNLVSAEPDEAPFSLIVIAKGGIVNPHSELCVLLTNISSVPQWIWSKNDFEGECNLSFELVMDGISSNIRRSHSARFATVPAEGVRIMPGDHYIFNVNIILLGWNNLPVAQEPKPATMSAIYKNKINSSEKKYEVWVGEVRSKPVQISFLNPKGKYGDGSFGDTP